MERFQNLYIHFPFCESKCHYCDFFSLPVERVGAPAQARAYDALIKEIDLHFAATKMGPLETVYLGGGTPSLAPVDVLCGLVERLRHAADGTFAPAEFTIEANPSSIERQKAEGWKRAGVNRVSIGIQALANDRLNWLGRVHSKEKAIGALEAVFEAGIGSVSIDYIVGVPGQNVEHIKHELHELLDMFTGIDHVSAYLLTLKESNPRFEQLPDDETQLAHLRAVSRTLGELGFDHYEVSNFARPDRRARHNENYWLGRSYLGVGPSAHSYSTPVASPPRRSKNWGSLEKYCDLVESGAEPIEWSETLTHEQLRLEYLMLRLRRADGLDFEDYRARFGADLIQKHAPLFESWQKLGLCHFDSKLRLTPEGFFLSDHILSQIP